MKKIELPSMLNAGARGSEQATKIYACSQRRHALRGATAMAIDS
jgi:DNA-binding CsgD family transcriptional regulator